MSVRLCPSCGTPAAGDASRCTNCDAVLDPDVAAPEDHTAPPQDPEVELGTISGLSTRMYGRLQPSTDQFSDDAQRRTPGQLAAVSFFAVLIGALLLPAGYLSFLTPVLAAIGIACAIVSFRRTPGWGLKPLALGGFVLGVLLIVTWSRLAWFAFVAVSNS
jgi:hypothetical protein